MSETIREVLAAKVRKHKCPVSISPAIWDIASYEFSRLIAGSPELANVEQAAELTALRAENERLRVEVAQLKSILESTSITRRGTIVS